MTREQLDRLTAKGFARTIPRDEDASRLSPIGVRMIDGKPHAFFLKEPEPKG